MCEPNQIFFRQCEQYDSDFHIQPGPILYVDINQICMRRLISTCPTQMSSRAKYFLRVSERETDQETTDNRP